MKNHISIKLERKWIFVAETILLHKCKSQETQLKSIFCLGSVHKWYQSLAGGENCRDTPGLLVGPEQPQCCFTVRDLRVEDMKRENPELKLMSLLRGREKRWEWFSLGRWNRITERKMDTHRAFIACSAFADSPESLIFVAHKNQEHNALNCRTLHTKRATACN